MAGYLDQYGAGEERREKIIKTLVISLVTLAVLGGIGFFVFHNYRQERQVKRFFELLQARDYQSGYTLWVHNENDRRGYNIPTLAENAIFEEVIFLLWNGWLPKQAELDKLKKDLVAERGVPGPVLEFLKSVENGNPMDVLRTAVSMLSLHDPEAQDMS